jgi:hypothetical protein
MNGRALFLVAVTACATEPETGSSQTAVTSASSFVLPSLSAPRRAEIVDRYSSLDPGGVVPRGLLEDAIVYFDVNQASIPKQSYLVVVDFSRYSGRDRFWMVDLGTGAVENHKVAHGQGSDPNNTGYAVSFSNVSGSYQSSLGYYLSAEIYDGTHPHSMRIDGLSPDGSPDAMADTNVRSRAIVVHEATYVSDSNTSQQGRSDGCFALDPAIENGVVDRIHDGTLMYAEKQSQNTPVGTNTCGNGTCDSREDQLTCPEDCGACGTIPFAGTVIDDGDPCFIADGPAARLHAVTSAGQSGTLVWAPTSTLLAEQNFAEWSFDFAQAGRYRVEAYTAAAYAQSKQARYRLHASADQDVMIDQTAVDGWQSLGEFDFAQGPHQSLHLGDDTGEDNVQLVFDAVRLTRVGDGSGSGSGSGIGSDGGGSGSGAGGGHGGGCSTGGGAGGLLALVALRRRRRR